MVSGRSLGSGDGAHHRGVRRRRRVSSLDTARLVRRRQSSPDSSCGLVIVAGSVFNLVQGWLNAPVMSAVAASRLRPETIVRTLVGDQQPSSAATLRVRSMSS